MNLTQAISEIATRQPKALAIRLDRQDMSYAELDAAVARLAALIAAQGISRGDVAAIVMRTSPLHLLTILALSYLGAVSISLPPREPAATRAALARRYGVKLAIASRAGYDIEGIPTLKIESGWQRGAGPAGVPRTSAAEETPWRIALSSGTTGTPKAMLVRHGDIAAYARLTVKRMPGGAGEGTRLLCFRGIESNVVLRPCLRQLLCGGALIFTASATLQTLIGALRDEKVTHASMPPPLLRSLCELLDAKGPHFPDLVQLTIGGAALSPALLERACARVTPHVFSNYGASEAGMIAIASANLLRRQPDCAGKLAPWLEVQAVDGNDRPLAAGEAGALRFRGPGVVTEYHLDPEATARYFRQGWFHSGDVGRIDKGGLLFLAGRTDDRINIGGIKIDPTEIERVIESHPQVVEAAVFAGRPETGREFLCAAVVLRGKLATSVLIEHCRDALDAQHAPARFVSTRKLPRNENGKLLRRELPPLLNQRKPAGARGNAP